MGEERGQATFMLVDALRLHEFQPYQDRAMLRPLNDVFLCSNPSDRCRTYVWGHERRRKSSLTPFPIRKSRCWHERSLEGFKTNAAGFPRNSAYFWREALQQHPEYFSPRNAKAIKGRPPRAPVIDEQWIRYHPEQARYLNERLIHHHIDQGAIAVPLPESIHRAWTSVLHPHNPGNWQSRNDECRSICKRTSITCPNNGWTHGAGSFQAGSREL